MFALSTAPRQCAAALAGLLLLLTLAPITARAQDSLSIGGTATISGAESLRSGPGWDAAGTTDLAAGTPVTIADGPITAADGSAWYQIDAAGQLGYVPAYALGGGAPAVAAPAEPAAAEWTEPAADPAATGWVDPATGLWVEPAPAADPAALAQETVAEPMAPAAPVGTAWITGTNGDGAVCRSSADYAAGEIGIVPEGSTVEVAGGQAGDWTPINCSGTVGYVNAQFLSWEQPAAPAAQPLPVDEPAALDPALTEPEFVDPAAVAPPADPAPEAEPALEPELAPVAGRRNGGGGGGSGGGGQAVANYAMQFVGYPYVYAGAGPDAFDCSGFTMYVVQQSLGIDITHDMFTQIGMGQSVGRGELQAGDLVFFQDTFRPGLSHAGVYIGGGQFVHAENESTGVRVSDINSDYYSSRFYGATRLW